MTRQPKPQAEVQDTPGGGTTLVSPIKPNRTPPHRGQDPEAATSTSAWTMRTSSSLVPCKPTFPKTTQQELKS